MEKFDPRRMGGETVRGQVGALCYRIAPAGGVEVLLVTSRDTGRWIIPKGWPMPDRPAAAAALREAFEEAGVEGDPGSDAVGIFTYPKRLGDGQTVTCLVSVYPIRVMRQRSRFPEAGERRREWLSPEAAASRVQEPELAELLRGFDPAASEGTSHVRPTPGD